MNKTYTRTEVQLYRITESTSESCARGQGHGSRAHVSAGGASSNILDFSSDLRRGLHRAKS
eukprot:4258020-Pyramimonas_sp.AAC.1